MSGEMCTENGCGMLIKLLKDPSSTSRNNINKYDNSWRGLDFVYPMTHLRKYNPIEEMILLLVHVWLISAQTHWTNTFHCACLLHNSWRTLFINSPDYMQTTQAGSVSSSNITYTLSNTVIPSFGLGSVQDGFIKRRIFGGAGRDIGIRGHTDVVPSVMNTCAVLWNTA